MRGENLRQRVKKDFDDVCLQLRGGGVKQAASWAGTLPSGKECENTRMDEGSETGWSDNCGTISPKNFKHLHTQTPKQSLPVTRTWHYSVFY